LTNDKKKNNGGAWLHVNALKQKRILLVDDNPFFSTSMSNQLRCLGAEITAVSTAVQGLMALENGRFNLVVIDLLLPDMHGWDFYTTIRERYPAETLPAVFLSGTINTDEATAMSKGPGVRTRTISKVADPEEIIHCICEVIASP
jgi:CheY-like chemotaxis protein